MKVIQEYSYLIQQHTLVAHKYNEAQKLEETSDKDNNYDNEQYKKELEETMKKIRICIANLMPLGLYSKR